MNAYTLRNRTLREMGFPSYALYLASPLWGRIRQAQLVEHPDCWGCGRRACQVHHGAYDKGTLAGATKKHLWSVCAECHGRIEFQGRRKLSPAKATSILHKIREGRLKAAKPDTHRKRALSAEQRAVLKLDLKWGAQYAHQLLADED